MELLCFLGAWFVLECQLAGRKIVHVLLPDGHVAEIVIAL